MGSLRNSDLILIAQCFPFLEHLDLSFPKDTDNSTFPVSDVSVKALSLALPMLHSVDLSRNFFINDASILNLCKNYNFLEQVTIFECHFITQRGIASTIKERPCLRSFRVSNFRHQGETLVLQGCCNYSYVGVLCLLSTFQSLEHLDLQNAEFLCDQRVEELCEYLGNLVSVNVGGCRMLTDLALFALVRGCPLLNEIRMGGTDVGKRRVDEDLMNSVVNCQVKSLYLGNNSLLRGESVEMFASVCPSLEVLDLSSCCGIYLKVLMKF